uniref:Uncharacterized protein n=1 Tax=Hyaloperonospora arabidopsidis (strain Emoy2) TaxID=559515 RepID=M4B567_HYAAE
MSSSMADATCARGAGFGAVCVARDVDTPSTLWRTVIRIGDKLGPVNARVDECGGAGWRCLYQPAAPRVSPNGAGAHRANHADTDDEFMRASVSLGCLTLIKCATPTEAALQQKKMDRWIVVDTTECTLIKDARAMC